MTKRSSKHETYSGLVILALLVCIAACVFMKQFNYDPSTFTISHPDQSRQAQVPLLAGDSSERTSDFQDYVPYDFKPFSPPEVFTAENLSDKIDGKAELYLSAGFERLWCERFVSDKNSASWIEIFVYEMGSDRNAFAVYSAQKRSDAKKLEFTQFAYRTDNALFFVHSKKYVEVVASTGDSHIGEAMSTFAQQFVRKEQKTPSIMSDLAESELFPRDHLEDGSIALLASDAFGFGEFDNIYKASYNFQDIQVTAFLSRRPSPLEAAKLCGAYHHFLIENGGLDAETNVRIPGAVLVRVFDTYDLIFMKGRLIGGVHQADNKALAEKLGSILYDKLPEDTD